jgi:hypothetical protein
LGFELGTELASVFIGHVLDRFSGLGLTIPPVQFSGATSLLHRGIRLRRAIFDQTSIGAADHEV